jgi:NAD(P)-dependent dehydrogenase (short-subunit alcohol dehydrogenase family)
MRKNNMAEQNNLQGRGAIVTGAAMGIGKAIATAYVRAGLRVALLDRAGAALQDTAAALKAEGGTVFPIVVDLLDATATTQAIHDAIAALGTVDVLVSNAGILHTKSFADHTLADWDETLSINLRPAFVLSKVMFPYFKERGGGVILFVTSMSGIMGFLNESAYCASKHGLEGFMKCLAMEGEPHHIRVNTVTPGHGTHTPLSEANYTEEEKKLWVDPILITPAFVELATTQLTGQRLNAWQISEEIRARG